MTKNVTLKTSEGDITIALDMDKTPITAKNFKQYADDGFYDGVIFHRVIDGFMIQAGGFEPGMEEKTTRESIENEAHLGGSNKRGTVAMARTNDPHSASAQFFINVKDNAFLDHRSQSPDGWGYCVFGEVVEGMDVVDRIKSAKTKQYGMHGDVPEEDILIIEAV